ncbi:hypothetical protein D5F11_013395 [Siminovitchia terrae]|uniref:Uncharacterized protein n=1 Tax=Siminovitchia terrae TaxID=1914933 RepID=A0A429X6X8_SIMTE|nr:ABC-three component system middle component 1 [Siminovitchia terrae]RST59122.1 hypothetical protein D5F11_013395 [Siminovitchia terrae]
MKLINKENIKEILRLEGEKEYESIKCFQYISDSNKYRFYVFSCYYNDEEELKTHFKPINDIIAFDFQSKLLLDVERWNLYIFFFVGEKISHELKTSIEQNKYATRKILYDNMGKEPSSEQIEEMILNKLFKLELSPENIKYEGYDVSLQDIIKQKDSYLISSIKEVSGIQEKGKKEINKKKADIVQRYLEMRKNG